MGATAPGVQPGNYEHGVIMLRETIIRAARELRSEQGENVEYDRALVELSAHLLGVADDRDRDELEAEILGDI